MTLDDLKTMILRDLAAVKRELLAYPDEDQLWAVPEGVPNSAGTLALHLAGNLHHYIGTVLGGADYVRARDDEFGLRGMSRDHILARVDAAADAVADSLDRLPEERLTALFPQGYLREPVLTGRFLLHLATHLSYHLGQMDYHRRMVTGDGTGVDALSLQEIF